MISSLDRHIQSQHVCRNWKCEGTFSLGVEHHGFIALLIPVLIDAAKTSAVGVKYSLSWVSGVSGIRPNLIRGTVLFKAMTLEICDLHTQFCAVRRP